MCSWYIVDRDMVLKVVIAEFHLDDDSTCLDDDRIPVSIHMWKRKKLIGWAVFTDLIISALIWQVYSKEYN